MTNVEKTAVYQEIASDRPGYKRTDKLRSGKRDGDIREFRKNMIIIATKNLKVNTKPNNW